VPIIPIDILKQKFLLQKGYLHMAFNNHEKAAEMFQLCIKVTRQTDSRIRKDCFYQMQHILNLRNLRSADLEKQLINYESKRKDFIFLMSVEESMADFAYEAKIFLKDVLKQSLEPHDRISL
jgi:hypothetical protein